MTDQLAPVDANVEDSHRKPPIDPASLHHTALLDGEFWRRIPAYAT